MEEPGTSEADAGLQIIAEYTPCFMISPVQGLIEVPQKSYPPS